MARDRQSAVNPESLGVELPYSLEAEQAVLGSILNDSSVLDDVSALLRPEDFYSPQNASIFREILMLQATEKAVVDFVTVLNAVTAAGIFRSGEDAKVYLFSICDTVPATSNAVAYAKIVADKYKTRSVIGACSDVINYSVEEKVEADELLDYAEQKIYDIRGGRNTSQMAKIEDVSYNVLNQIDLMNGPDAEKYRGIPTGFGGLDNYIVGLNSSDLVVLAARPGVGKTTLALNIVCNIARSRRDMGIAFFSLEMTNEQLDQRLISSVAGVPVIKFRTGKFTDEEELKVTEAASDISQTGIFMDDTPGITVQEIKAKARRIKNLGLVVVDYLQLMSSNKRTENRVNEVSEITRAFKVLAKDLEVPVIVLSQLSRSNEKDKRKPRLSDLRESGSIEQDADIVLLLHNEEQQSNPENGAGNEAQNVSLIIGKNRHGDRGEVLLRFDGVITRFTSREMGRDD